RQLRAAVRDGGAAAGSGRGYAATDQAEELLSRAGVRPEDPAEGAGNGPGILFLDAPHHHTEVFGFDDHAYAARSKNLFHRGRDLLGQPLLHLEPPGKYIDYSRQLGQPHDPAVRDVGDMGPPEERKHVVLAETVELDVAHHHHVLVRLL